jgi:non-specific protein-tyrosine kinase
MSKIERALKKAEEERSGASGAIVPDRRATGVAPAPRDAIGIRQEMFLAPQFSEWFRKIAARLKSCCDQSGARDVLFTSAIGGEGKTTTAVNCAISLAQDYNLTVCLVDCDLRRPSIGRYFESNGDPTIVNHLKGEVGIDAIIRPTSIEGLSVITSHVAGRGSLSLLNTDRLSKLVHELKARFDFVVIDAPPVLPVADAGVLARSVSATLLVVECGRTRRKQLQQVMEQIDRDKIVGFVVNYKKFKSFEPNAYARYHEYETSEE